MPDPTQDQIKAELQDSIQHSQKLLTSLQRTRETALVQTKLDEAQFWLNSFEPEQ